MKRLEFGLEPTNCVPLYLIGARGIIDKYGLDIPYDRWSNSFLETNRKQELINFVNETALQELEKRVKKHDTKGFFDSVDGKFRCEYDDRNSGGYLYCGFYNLTIENGDENYEGDEIIGRKSL